MLEMTTHEYVSAMLLLFMGTLAVGGVGRSGVHLARGKYLLRWDQRLLVAGYALAHVVAVILMLTAP